MSINEDVLRELQNDAVRTTLLEIIERNIPTKNYNLSIESGSEKGDNYIGVVYRISVTYTLDSPDENNEEQRKFGIFLKVPPDSLLRRELFFARDSFLRESFIYGEFLPLIREFHISKGIIPEQDGFYEYSKCYKSLTGDLEEAIFMEDLSLSDYQMVDRLEDQSLELVKLVMRKIGKLHALSFALRDQWPHNFARFQGMKEIFINKNRNEQFYGFLNSMSEIALSAVSKKGYEAYYQIIDRYFKENTLCNYVMELVDSSKTEPYTVVCHGDCWTNNILFKFKNGQLVDAKLIDWQIARYAAPVCDVLYYIFCCTSKTLRDKHYRDILDTYYNELATFLRRLGSNPNTLYPRTAFEDQMKNFGAFGLLMGLVVIPTITAHSEDALDLDEISEQMDKMGDEVVEEYRKKLVEIDNPRIRDLIVDIIELGYI